jgi:hypothetical protein
MMSPRFSFAHAIRLVQLTALFVCFISVTLFGQTALPRLERISIRSLDTLGPEKANASVAISPLGLIAFTGAFDQQNRAVTLIDSAGRLLARMGPPGQGPGELSQPLQLAFIGRELIALELGARRLSRFSVEGSLLATVATIAPIFLSATSSDSIDIFQFPTSGASPVLDFRRLSPRTLQGRTLLSGQSSALRDLSAEGRQQGAAVASIMYAASGSTVIAANVVTYRLIGIAPDERVLFDLRGSRSEAPAGETALFAVGGLQVDAQGRIWAIGASQQTGRTFADVYLGSRSLGRLDLPCRGSVTIGGRWMAILCSTPSSPNRDVELQIHRIIDPPHASP